MDTQSKTYLITYDDDSAEIDVRSDDGFEVMTFIKRCKLCTR